VRDIDNKRGALKNRERRIGKERKKGTKRKAVKVF
jgi:hypothetical protein